MPLKSESDLGLPSVFAIRDTVERTRPREEEAEPVGRDAHEDDAPESEVAAGDRDGDRGSDEPEAGDNTIPPTAEDDGPPAATDPPDPAEVQPTADSPNTSADRTVKQAKAQRAMARLDAEPRAFLQFAAPASIREELQGIAFELAYTHEHLSEHTTIIGGIAWHNFDHRDERRRRRAQRLLDDYLRDPISTLPKDVKLGGYVPLSVKRAVDGTAVALKRVLGSRATSRALLCAALWNELLRGNGVHDDAALARLAALLEPYSAAVDPVGAAARAAPH